MAATSAPQAMPPQHLWDPKTKSAHLKMALWMRVSLWGSFPISFSQTCKNISSCVAMYANCCGLLLIVVFIELFVTAALHALILIFFYLLISGLGYPGLVVFQQLKHFPHQKQAAGTLHQQQAAGEAKHTHSIEITIKHSGSTRQTVSAYRQQPRAVHPVRRDLSYISKKGEYGHKEGGHRCEDGA